MRKRKTYRSYTHLICSDIRALEYMAMLWDLIDSETLSVEEFKATNELWGEYEWWQWGRTAVA